jgi:hypothetical protein
MYFLCKVFLFLPLILLAEELAYQDRAERLFQDLEKVREIDSALQKHVPFVCTDFGLVGYFAMPSARMPKAGLLGFGVASASPYEIWSLSAQLFDHLETVGSYFIYRGVTEPTFGHLGFGDDAERSASLKLALLKKDDGLPLLPHFALGWIDFLGTKRFHSFFVAATQEWNKANIEATLGWGCGRIQGFYGGLAWSPYQWLTFAAEYDANNYKQHPYEHPAGRTVRSRINIGVQARIWNLATLSLHSLRGEQIAGLASLHYNLGESQGLFPKMYDPPICRARSERLHHGEDLSRTLASACQEAGFDLHSVYLLPQGEGLDALWMRIINVRYREEERVHARIQHVLAAVVPSSISRVTVVIEADGVPVYEYRFRQSDLVRYQQGTLSDAEFQVIAPLHDASAAPTEYARLYRRSSPICIFTFRPRLLTFFGSSTGKFKAQMGFSLSAEGYPFDLFYYFLQGSFTVFSQIQNLRSLDVLNPSHLINVRTDNLLYHQAHSFHLDSAYLQRSWHFGSGWFSRVAAGYFETAYGGMAAETLLFPVRAEWAIGMEGAVVWKRKYFGLKYTNRIRKLTETGLIHVPFLGVQYFVSFYYNYRPLNLDLRICAGQFLAKDKGIRLEGGRIFPSGLRLGLWWTFTNAKDVVNNRRYYDKGVSLTMPLDLFMNQSSRTRIGLTAAAWLRDCGARAYTGKELYQTLFWERYNQHPLFY